MTFRGDIRAQSVQIGAVIMFGVLVVAFSTYQATVVPQQNKQAEVQLSLDTEGDIQQLRKNILLSGASETTTTTTVRLGRQYPTRAVARNPSDPYGVLTTSQQRLPITLTNATASGEAGDFWTGETRTYHTKRIRYTPEYHFYQNAPAYVVENTVLYAAFDSRNLTRSGQALIQGNRISLVAINGSLRTQATGVESVTAVPLSSSQSRVGVTDSDGPITIQIESELTNQAWGELLANEMDTDGPDSRYVADYECTNDAPAPCGTLTLTLERDKQYSLSLARVGLGDRRGVVPDDDGPDRYLTVTSGSGAVISERTTHTISLEVRDEYNNPVSDVSIAASATDDASAVSVPDATSGVDGRIDIEYTARDITGERTVSETIQASLTLNESQLPAAEFNGSTVQNVSVPLTVQNSDRSGLSNSVDAGAYSVSWTNPASLPANADEAGNLSDCSATSCTWTRSGSGAAVLNVSSMIGIESSGFAVEYGVNDTAVADLTVAQNDTNVSGVSETAITREGKGPVEIYAVSGGSRGTFTLRMVGNEEPTASFTYDPSNPEVDETVEFDASASSDPDGTIETYEWDVDGDGTYELEGQVVTYTYDSNGQREVTLRVTDNNGTSTTTSQTVDVTGGGFGPGFRFVVVAIVVVFLAAARYYTDT